MKGNKLFNKHVSKMMIRSLFYEQNDYSIVIVTLIAINSAYLQMANFIVFHAYAVVLIS